MTSPTSLIINSAFTEPQQHWAENPDRTLRLEQVGSIAEAALSLNRVFEAAQAAADQYLESVKAQYPVQGTEFSPTANNEGAYWK